MPGMRVRELIVAPPSPTRPPGRPLALDGDTLMGLPAADKIAIRAYEFACTSLTAAGCSCTP